MLRTLTKVLSAALLAASWIALLGSPNTMANENQSNWQGFEHRTVLGNRLPGNWRPFADDSLWNQPIAPDASTHPDNAVLMETIMSEASHLRLANRYTVPVWIVNSENITFRRASSPYPFDIWDQDYDRLTDVGAPYDESMFAESTKDAHISIVDPANPSASCGTGLCRPVCIACAGTAPMRKRMSKWPAERFQAQRSRCQHLLLLWRRKETRRLRKLLMICMS